MSDEISGFDWWFRNRDYVLRERLAEVEDQAYAASARSNARLSSQLSRLQGSLEGRLSALSAAFDAYVELGDIREQLSAFGDSAAIRREALTAIAALGNGQPTKPVDDRGSDSWLATATNALISRVGGAPDEAAESAVGQQDPSAELFLVAGAGALGRGPEMASRVPALLAPDASHFDSHQQVIWRAVIDGVFGDDLLAALLQNWRSSLSTDGLDWSNWAHQEAGRSGRTMLDWIEQESASTENTEPADDAEPAQTPAPVPDLARVEGQDSGLRGLVFELINAGQGEERDLLARARELRARIENPTVDDTDGRRDSGSPRPGENPTDTGISGLDLIRKTYVDSSVDRAARAELRTVIYPGLLAAVEYETPTILHQESTSTVVRINGRSVPVTADGPDRQALATAQAAPMIINPATGTKRLYGLSGVGAAALVLALILALAGVSAGVVILLLIAAIVLGVLAGRVLLARRREQRDADQQRRTDLTTIDQAVLAAKESDAAQRTAVRQSADQLDRIRSALAIG